MGDFLDGISYDGATPAGVRTPKIKGGRYPRLVVQSCKLADTRYGSKYFVDFLVDAEPERVPDEGEPSEQGTVVCWTCTLNPQFPVYFVSETLSFMNAVHGVSDGDDLPDTVKSLLRNSSGTELLVGKAVEGYVTTRTTENNRTVTKVAFTPCETGGTVVAPPPLPPPTNKKSLPEGFFHFPEDDARHGKEAYNAAGETVQL